MGNVKDGLISKLSEKLRPPKFLEEVDNRFKVNALVLFKNDLYECDFSVSRFGFIRIDSEKLLLGKLQFVSLHHKGRAYRAF